MNPLRKARLTAKLTQVELSDESGVSQSFISRLEKMSSLRSASVETIFALAKALKIDPTTLVAKKRAA